MKFTSIIAAGALAAVALATDPKVGGLADFSWEVEGYAKENPYGGAVSGGRGGATVTVTDYPTLATAVAGNKRAVIKVLGAIKAEARLQVGSNKSIIGLKSHASVYEKGITVVNATNVIIQNLKVHDILGDDAITIRNSTRVWVDHCELYSDLEHGPDYHDGLLDIIRGSDYITVSWNYIHDHWKTSLVGNEPTFTHELGKYHVTYHHNYWARLGSRGPAGRFGFHHIYNNYYEDFFYQAIHSRSDNQALIEGNVFRGDMGEAISTHGLVVPEDSPNFCVCGDEEKDGYANLGTGLARNDFGMATINITQVGSFNTAPYKYKLTPLKFVEGLVKLGAGVGKVDIDYYECLFSWYFQVAEYQLEKGKKFCSRSIKQNISDVNEQQFLSLLEAILQPNTEVVKQATATLQKEFFSKPQSLPLLIKVLSNHPEQAIRQIAAVQAGRLVPQFWTGTGGQESPLEGQKAAIREALLQAAAKEPASIVKHSTARVISSIARFDLPEGKWDSLPQHLHQAATSSNVTDRELGVFILFSLIETFEEQFSDKWSDFFTLFQSTLSDQESLQVRVYTLMALGKMSETFDGDEDSDSIKKFRTLLPTMVEVLKQVIASGDPKMCDNAFEVFLNALGGESSLIGNYLKDLIELMISLAENSANEEDVRSKALNFLLTTVRIRKIKVQSMKLGERLTTIALNIAAEPQEDDEGGDDSAPSRIGILLINFLAEALPPSQVVLPLMKRLGPLISSQNPNERRAALLAIGACVEGAPDFVGTQIEHVVPVIHGALSDPEIQVRKAALHTLANLADELGEDMGQFHAQIVPILIQMLDVASDPIDIKRSCCYAIDAVLGEVDAKEMPKYLDSIMPRLSTMFTQDDIPLKTAAVGAIASTARGSGELFKKYFADTMNALSGCLTIKDGEDELNLRSVTLDCMGAIAEAVGQQDFTPYVNQLMDAAAESIKLDHTRLREGAFSFWAILAKVYGPEFAPFLEPVFTALLESVEQAEIDVDATDGDDAPILVSEVGGVKLETPIMVGDMIEDADDDDTWEDLATVTAISLEKEVAIDAIGEIITHCTQACIPYLEKVVQILVEKINHMYEGVRRAAVDTLWRTYAATWTMQTKAGVMAKWEPGLPLEVKPTQELQGLGELIMSRTLALCLQETEREVVTAVAHNLGEALKLCGPAALADNDGAFVLESLVQIGLILSKKHMSQLELDDEGEVLEGLEESSEYDWVLIEAAFDWLQGFAAALGPTFVEPWTKLSPEVMKYASSTEPIERSHAVGVTADCIRYMQHGVTKHTANLMQVLLRRLGDENFEVKSNAAYGIGLLCYYSEDKQEVVKSYNDIFAKLEILFETKGHRGRDNACGCVARMVVANPDAITDLGQVIDTLTGVLPLEEDFEENEPIYSMFMQLYKAQNQAVFPRTDRLLPLFEKVLSTPYEENKNPLLDSTRSQLQELVAFIHQNK